MTRHLTGVDHVVIAVRDLGSFFLFLSVWKSGIGRQLLYSY